MTGLVPLVRSQERRFLVLLRAPRHELRALVPDGLEPVGRQDMGFLLLDHRQRCPMEVGPWPLGAGSMQLVLGIPVDEGDPSTRGLWIPRRWDDWRLRRHLPERLLGPRSPRVAEFHSVEAGAQVELEVRCEGVRQLYLRAEDQATLSDSLFQSPRDAEQELATWSRDIQGPGIPLPIPGETSSPLVDPEVHCLRPLLIHAVQTAAIPELLGGVEASVQLDSAFRVTRHRVSGAHLALLRNWRDLRRRPLNVHPEGACSVVS